MEKQTLEQAIIEFEENYFVDLSEFFNNTKTLGDFKKDLTSLIQLAQGQQGKEILDMHNSTGQNNWSCTKCDTDVTLNDNYCNGCGSKFNWINTTK